jgi:hypothetical protein
VAEYNITFARSAGRELEALDASVIARILPKIESLAITGPPSYSFFCPDSGGVIVHDVPLWTEPHRHLPLRLRFTNLFNVEDRPQDSRRGRKSFHLRRALSHV